MDTHCALIVGGVAVLLTALGYGYKIKVDNKTLHLEKKDLEHERKHIANEARIKELEKKNGAEQHQIDELKEQIAELKTILKKKSTK
jgi:predicted RNase H-like nuclease (RuvC/YqgF family)